MNQHPFLPDALFLVSMIGAAICLPLLNWLLKKEAQKNKASRLEFCKQQEEYVKSPEHAATIAFQISCKKTGWIKSEEGQRLLEGESEAVRDHLFLDSVVFREEGITARIVVKNSQCIVGISYEDGSEAFAQEVARILGSNYSTKVAVRSKAKTASGEDTMLGGQRI